MKRIEYLAEILRAVFHRTAIKKEPDTDEVVYEKGWFDVCTFSLGYRDEKYLPLFNAALTDPDVFVMKSGSPFYLRNDHQENAVRYFREHGAKCLMGVEIDLENEETRNHLGEHLYEAFRIMLYDLFGKGYKRSDDVESEYGLKLAEAIHYLEENIHFGSLNNVLIEGKNLILKDPDCGGEYHYAYFQRTPVVSVNPLYINIIPLPDQKDVIEERIPGLQRIEIHDSTIRLLPSRQSIMQEKYQVGVDPPNAVYVPITSQRIDWIPVSYCYLTNLKEACLDHEEAEAIQERMRDSATKIFIKRYGKHIAAYYMSVMSYIESVLEIIIKTIDNGMIEGIKDKEQYMTILKLLSLEDQQLAEMEAEWSRSGEPLDLYEKIQSEMIKMVTVFAGRFLQKELVKGYTNYVGPDIICGHYRTITENDVIEKLENAAKKYQAYLSAEQSDVADIGMSEIKDKESPLDHSPSDALQTEANHDRAALLSYSKVLNTEKDRVIETLLHPKDRDFLAMDPSNGSLNAKKTNCYKTLLNAIEIYLEQLKEILLIGQDQADKETTSV